MQSAIQIRVQTARKVMRTQTIMILTQQQNPGQVMVLAKIRMMTLAFLTRARQVVLLARLELVAAVVEGMGKGKGM